MIIADLFIWAWLAVAVTGIAVNINQDLAIEDFEHATIQRLSECSVVELQFDKHTGDDRPVLMVDWDCFALRKYELEQQGGLKNDR